MAAYAFAGSLAFAPPFTGEQPESKPNARAARGPRPQSISQAPEAVSSPLARAQLSSEYAALRYQVC
jgi:hypothetical protein